MITPPETILLAVTGMSPAILTETLWALASEPEPVIPQRVIAITTQGGRSELIERLFHPDPRLGLSPWEALRAALSAAGHDLTGRLRFGATADDIRVMTTTNPVNGRTAELADLRTVTDNEAAADFILEQVRGVVENPDTHLVASLAGGRKTMGALLYACMTLLGRETDRLTHVLVNEPFETLRGFWFPGQPGGPIARTAGDAPDPASARIELADVPFVPLRNLFRKELGRTAGRFAGLVAAASEHVREHAGENLRLVIRRSRLELEVNGTRIKTAPREQIVLLFLAQRAKAREPVLGAYNDAIAPLNDLREQLRAEAPPNDLSDWRHGDSLSSPFDDDSQDIRRAISSLRRKLQQTGQDGAALSSSLPGRGRFSLTVPGPLIELAP